MNQLLKAVAFQCPKCKIEINVQYAYLEDTKLWLQGYCSECKDGWRFSAEEVEKKLWERVPSERLQ